LLIVGFIDWLISSRAAVQRGSTELADGLLPNQQINKSSINNPDSL
jgi:hypothetical protein